MTHEQRTFQLGELRAVDTTEGEHSIDLRVLKYGTVDDFGSLWAPGVFAASVAKRMPVLAWGHDWHDPIGKGIASADSPNGPGIRFRLDDFDAVPRAKQAHAQVRSGTITDCSVGFSVPMGGRRDPTEEELKQYPGVREVIEKADLDEVSLVVRGAVPGAQVMGVRARVLEPMFRTFVDFVDGKRDLTSTLADLRRASEARAMMSEDDGDPVDLLQACDAALDQAAALLDGVDTSGLPAEVQQALALMTAASTAIDEALDVLGIDDPDEDSQTADEMAGLDDQMAMALAGLKD